MGECLTTHIPTKDNLSDMITKVINVSKNRGLVKVLMYDVFDSHEPIDKEGTTVLWKKHKQSWTQ